MDEEGNLSQEIILSGIKLTNSLEHGDLPISMKLQLAIDGSIKELQDRAQLK